MNLLDLHHPDIIFGSESWLKSHILSSEVFPSGYIVYRKDRPDGYGGVFIACRDTLSSSEIPLNDSPSELVACQIQLADHSSLIVASVYRPPSNDDTYLEELCNQLNQIHLDYPNSALWIAGDTNLPDIDWSNSCITGHSYSLKINHNFLDFISDNALTQMNNTPTRGSNILDVFITDRPSLVESCDVVSGISDHEALFVKSLVTARLSQPSKRTIYLWSQANFHDIRNQINSLCEEFVGSHTSSTPIETLWNSFQEICNTCLDLVPTKLSSSNIKQPWINNYIKRLSRRKQRAYNCARRNNQPQHWTKYYSLKKECQRECRSAYNKYVSNMVDPNKNTVTKKLWSYIKSKRQDNIGGVGPIKYQGETHTDPLSKANIFANYFSSVFTNEDTSNIPTMDGEPLPCIDAILIHVEGIAELLRNIDPNKANGPDQLPARFLKEVSLEIAPALTLIFQASLDQSKLPEVWKEALVVPVFKKGNRSDPCNFRPISLTCICGKILEHVVHSNISKHLQRYEVLCDEQHGFRTNRSCDTQLITTVNDFAKCLNEGGQCDVLTLDFSKAFDKVPHARLYHKLSHYGIRGPILTWLQAFLTNRSQRVIVDNIKSHATHVLSGVPQGTVLAPLLFLIYINDLPTCVRNKVRLYADDVLLYSYVYSKDDCISLQRDLHALEKWSLKWKMPFNPLKCEFLRITNKTTPITHTYLIAESPIKEVTTTKYLGVLIDNKLNWNNHIQSIAHKASQVNGFLYRNLRQCPTNIKVICFKSMVRPILEYASSIWAPHTNVNIQRLEAVQRRAARFCFNNFSPYSSVTSMLQSLDLQSLQTRRNISKLIIMYKMINGNLHIPNPLLPNQRDSRRGYFTQLQTRIDSFKFSFFPSTVKLWNSLPPTVINSPTLNQFCNLINTCAL